MQLGKNVIFIQVKLIVLQPGHDMCCVTVGSCMFVSEGCQLTNLYLLSCLYILSIYVKLAYYSLYHCFSYGSIRNKEFWISSSPFLKKYPFISLHLLKVKWIYNLNIYNSNLWDLYVEFGEKTYQFLTGFN